MPPWSLGTPARAHPASENLLGPSPRRESRAGTWADSAALMPGARTLTPTARAALPAARPLRRPQSPLPGPACSPPPRAPASPRRHHHIVDDQIRRGQRPWALLFPRAATFTGPGPSPPAPIPLRRCSRRRCRHVKCPEHALLARAPPPGRGTARGRREGRGRGGAESAGRSQGQRPRRPPS